MITGLYVEDGILPIVPPVETVTPPRALEPIDFGSGSYALELAKLDPPVEYLGPALPDPVIDDGAILGPLNADIFPGTDADPIRPKTDAVPGKTFERRRYALMPPMPVGFFNEPATIPTAINYAAVTAQTRIEGAALARAENVQALREFAERQTIQRLQAEYGRIYTNLTGQPLNATTASTLTTAFNTAVFNINNQSYDLRDGTWSITTNGTNAITIPNGFDTVNVQQYVDAQTGDFRIIVNATVDNVYFAGMAAQNLADTIKHRIRSNMQALIKKTGSRKHLPGESKISTQELKARETLREMITESEYRRYIANGFIMVKAASGLWYQIFNKSAGYHVRSYKDGKPFESLCIHTDAQCPPTDHVINMKVLAEIDEEALRKGANITSLAQRNPAFDTLLTPAMKAAIPQKEESLLDVYRKYKPFKLAASA
jgi:hypothetical protein